MAPRSLAAAAVAAARAMVGVVVTLTSIGGGGVAGGDRGGAVALAGAMRVNAAVAATHIAAAGRTCSYTPPKIDQGGWIGGVRDGAGARATHAGQPALDHLAAGGRRDRSLEGSRHWRRCS
jgi:hypothetical protein